MIKSKRILWGMLLAVSATMGASQSIAGGGGNLCNSLPGWWDLKEALISANTGFQGVGLNNEMWGTIVAADGTVCAVAHTGEDNLQSQWLASRAISAQKANTANSLSLPAGVGFGGALSSGNLWNLVQPGGSLFGLQFSNPVDPKVAYRGNARRFGKRNDPMVGGRIGGINVFGGGLGLYNEYGDRVGGVGVSGDTSCRDHMVAWELRHNLMLDYVPDGVNSIGPMPLDPERPDNIIFDTDNGFGHPNCFDEMVEKAAVSTLSPVP